MFVNEGIVEDFKIKGNTKTKDYVIIREMKLKKGEPFNAKVISICRTQRSRENNFILRLKLQTYLLLSRVNSLSGLSAMMS